MRILTVVTALPALGAAYPYFHDGADVAIETRTLDELHRAAVAEGGVVTLWHGGDEKDQQNAMKQAFEKRFPGMTLNVTVDLSKYHDVNIDQQLAQDDLYVDVAILQTVQDFPRWKEQGVLAPYKPAGFDQVFHQIKDPEGYYTATNFFFWPLFWDANAVEGPPPAEYADFLKPEFKNKLVLTYPNDDDAVLYAFDQIIKQYGTAWFEALLAQNPRWVRGTATPGSVILGSKGKKTASFGAGGPLGTASGLRGVLPTEGPFTSWAQTGAILADAPHPAAARLLLSFLLGHEWQAGQRAAGGWSIRADVPPPEGFTQTLLEMPNTDPLGFRDFMLDRVAVERMRFWFEDRLGTAKGKSPLEDNL